MPFKTLQKQDATVKELTGAYSEIATQIADLQGQKEGAYSEMVRSQQQVMSGSKGADAKLKKAKETYLDLELQCDACADAMGQIRARLVDAMPDHLQAKLEDAKARFDKELQAYNELNRQYLELMAKAGVVWEQMKGRKVKNLMNGEQRVYVPEPVKVSMLSASDFSFYSQAVDEQRKESGNPGRHSSQSKIDSLRSEISSLNKDLKSGNFEDQADHLLGIFRKPESPAVVEPDGPQAPVHEIDWDKIPVGSENY